MPAVTERPLSTGPQDDLSARLQERVRGFIAFYEQNAYLAYNVALRIACEPEAAARASRLGFLRQVDGAAAGLLPAVVDAAIREAPKSPVPDGAGDMKAQRLMAAGAALAPPERAALAIVDLTGAGPELVAEALELDGDQALKLLERARAGFAARLGLGPPEAEAATRDWLWAAPPEEIWLELYPQFHRALERELRRGKDEPTLILTGAPEPRATQARDPGGSRRRARRLAGWLALRRWRRRPRWLVVGISSFVLAAAGLAVARQVTGGSPTPSSTPGKGEQGGVGGLPPGVGGASGQPGVNQHKPLTPAELDKLRLRELRQLNDYTKRQADKRLPPSKRRAAARGIESLQRQADRRLRAELRREQRLRDELARERAKANAPPPPPPPAPRRRARRRAVPAPPATSPDPTPSTRDESKQTCLLDEESGTYICPQ